MAPDLPDLPETLEDLTLRIEMAELRVVRRDLEFHTHWDSLQLRGKAALAPSHWLLPALGTGASWLFWRLIRRRPRRHGRGSGQGRRDHSLHAAQDAQAHREGDAGGAGGDAARPELGTLQLLTMLWSFMPTRLRGQLGPDMTQMLLGVIAGFIQGRKQQRKDRDAAEA
ncbi:hypothetical protein CDN99_07590 [Roseateles aquatilis]|uniref:Uncharacterized protein n=1 Tax=Roseateles aquatilis TaxID=431061 RepID=A0A246JHU0_9BURK|nr:hypothetical protein [Roseateles aquatilis]OWQ92194.1 hypothetical protein CDN99_07590 [Roseateles aquatilis]